MLNAWHLRRLIWKKEISWKKIQGYLFCFAPYHPLFGLRWPLIFRNVNYLILNHKRRFVEWLYADWPAAKLRKSKEPWTLSWWLPWYLQPDQLSNCKIARPFCHSETIIEDMLNAWDLRRLIWKKEISWKKIQVYLCCFAPYPPLFGLR